MKISITRDKRLDKSLPVTLLDKDNNKTVNKIITKAFYDLVINNTYCCTFAYPFLDNKVLEDIILANIREHNYDDNYSYMD